MCIYLQLGATTLLAVLTIENYRNDHFLMLVYEKIISIIIVPTICTRAMYVT